MSYTVNGVKTFRGHDGQGYNASLLRDGKKVAFITNLADGGEIQIDWLDIKAQRIEVKAVDAVGGEYTYRVTPEEKLFIDFLEDKTYVCQFTGNVTKHSYDTFIGELVEDFLFKRKMDRLSKKETLFRLKGDPEDQWRTIKRPYDEKVQAWLDKTYGDKLEKVYRPS